MKKRSLFAFILVLVLSLSIMLGGCGQIIDSNSGNGVLNSNFSKNSNMSQGIATPLESINKTPITNESLDREDDSNSILTQNRKSVVEVYSIYNDNSTYGASGIIIGYQAYAQADQDGNVGLAYVLTCHHAIDSATYVNVKDFYGNITPAGLIGSHPGGDTAVIWIKVKQEPVVAKIGASSDLLVGETIYAIGNPLNLLTGSVTKGVVSALSRDIMYNNQYIELLQVDAAINSGNDGGGLFTEDGYLVGLVNSGYSGKDGIAFAIPSDNFLRDANHLISTYRDSLYNSYGYIPNQASIGVSISIDDGSILSLTDTGSWKNSGVELYDKIVSVKIGEEVCEYSSAESILQFITSKDLLVGDTYILTVIRNSEQIDITIVVKQLIYIPPNGVLGENPQMPTTSISSSNSSSSELEDFSITNIEVLTEKIMYFGNVLTNYASQEIKSYVLIRPDDSNSTLTKNRKSVVEVYCVRGSVAGAGSGVFVGFTPFEDKVGGIAYIVTNHHVIEDASYVNIKDMFGEKLYPAGLIGSDEYSDTAVLYAELDYTPSVAKFCDSDDILVGDTIYAIGNPLGTLGGTVSKGIVSAKNRLFSMDSFAMELIQIDSAINHGSSGGGVFTEEGYLVAISNSGYPGYDGLGFSIPANTVLNAVNSIIETYQQNPNNPYGYVKGSVNLGFYSLDYGTVWSSGPNIGNQAVYISGLEKSGAFYNAGVQVNDIIYSITYKGKNIPIRDSGDIYYELLKAKITAGETLEIIVYRNRKLKTIQVQLEQYVYCPPLLLGE